MMNAQGVPDECPIAIPYVPDPDPLPGIHALPHSVDPHEVADHLPYNPATDRHETGGDEIEFADEAES